MPGGKKKGFFEKLGLSNGKKNKENAENGDEEGTSPRSGMEIPSIFIRADDSGAVTDDDLPTTQVVPGDQNSKNGNGSAAVKVDAAHSTSPTPSGERLSVSFSPGTAEPNPDTIMTADGSVDSKVRFSNDSHLSVGAMDDDDDDELSESLDAIMNRRFSGRRRSMVRRSPKRGVSPLGSDLEFGDKDRRRSSTMTSTSYEGETQIEIEEHELTEEQMFENIRLHRELVDSVKKQAWKMRKRLKIVRKAKAYVRKHEGELEQRLAQSKNTKDVMARYSLIFFRYWERIQRHAENLVKSAIPWEMRIKRIESHFGSAVASYFIFLRWIFWINIVMSIFIACFVIIPEVLAADRASAGDRKELLPGEEAKAFNLQTLWDFEGFLRYSPIFYGYYTDKDKTKQGYRIPFAYFLTLLGVYGYSFTAILQRMAENTRQSKLSDKDEDCTFTWKLFTSWDYMIGNAETADNKVASIVMGFKENILEEREKSKEGKSWKVWALRVLANVLVLILLVSSAYAVVLVVQRSREPEADDSWWRQNESTVVISLISLLYPNLFDLIGLLENNHPRTQLRLQLARIMILYLLNLYTLIFSLFSKVDEMSLALQAYKPSNIASSTVMPITSTVRSPMPPIFGGGLLPFFNTTTISPFWNSESDDRQIPSPDNFANDLLETFNLSLFHHQVWTWNYSCLVVRVNCDTKDYLIIANDSQSTPPSMAAHSSLLEDNDYGSPFYGALNSSYFPLPLLSFASIYNGTKNSNFSPSNLLFLSTSPQSDSGTYSRYSTKIPSYVTEVPQGTKTKFKVINRPRYKDVPSTKRPPTSNDNIFNKFQTTTRRPWVSFTYDYRDRFQTLSTPHPTLWFNRDFSSTPYPIGDANMRSEFFTVVPGYCVLLRCADLYTTTATPTPSFYDIYDRHPTTKFPNDYFTDPECLNSTISVEETSVSESPQLNKTVRDYLRRLCWETMFGQDLVKLTVMDLVMTVISILITDFFRALIVRVMNHCCCWDLEKQFPGYGDFKIAENILHLVNNQGMVWMGMFFAPGIPGINMVKIVIIMYIRSWAVLTCNIPHETVFKASNSSNFYYVLLLTMLFLCTLPVGYAIVWLEPSWHCGPFSQYGKVYEIFTSLLKSILPDLIIRGLGYAASPGIIIPLLVLLFLIIYYLNSVANSLRESNKDLKDQLRRERTEERRKVFQMADSRHDSNNKEIDEDKSKDGEDVEDGLVNSIKPTLINSNNGKILAGIHQLKKLENGDLKDNNKFNSKNEADSVSHNTN